MKKFVVIEDNEGYIVCHGSGFTWEEARSMVLSQMFDDAGCTDDGKLQNVSLYLLEANDPGMEVTYEYDGVKTKYYILEDPGKRDNKD